MDAQRMKTRAILGGAGVVVALALVATAAPHVAPAPAKVGDVIPVPVPPPVAKAPPPAPTPPPPIVAAPPPPPVRPVVEVVFVLDTTGSMEDLINGAKQKIWSIANHIASGQPTPEVRIGLVAYRDHGDAYVTRVYGLSGDLDGVYQKLMALRADGGGDTPEHVWKGLNDALTKMQWSETSTKMIFLVGDAPPHDDYKGFSRARVMKLAAEKEVVIHTVRAGDDPETARVWKSLASSGRGAYASIDLRGGWRKSKTPMDARLAELSRELDETTVGYGDGAVQARIRAKKAMGRGAGASVAADRGSFYASTGAKLDADDILEEAAAGKVDVNKLEPAKLPEPMQNMSPETRTAYVAAQKAKREQIMKEMKDLSAKRNDYIKAEKKAAPSAAPASMDDAVNAAVEAQAAEAGIKY
jgi:von Willebrand factor type A domain